MKKFNLFAIGVVAMLMAAVNVSAANKAKGATEEYPALANCLIAKEDTCTLLAADSLPASITESATIKTNGFVLTAHSSGLTIQTGAELTIDGENKGGYLNMNSAALTINDNATLNVVNVKQVDLSTDAAGNKGSSVVAVKNPGNIIVNHGTLNISKNDKAFIGTPTITLNYGHLYLNENRFNAMNGGNITATYSTIEANNNGMGALNAVLNLDHTEVTAKGNGLNGVTFQASSIIGIGSVVTATGNNHGTDLLAVDRTPDKGDVLLAGNVTVSGELVADTIVLQKNLWDDVPGSVSTATISLNNGSVTGTLKDVCAGATIGGTCSGDTKHSIEPEGNGVVYSGNKATVYGTLEEGFEFDNSVEEVIIDDGAAQGLTIIVAAGTKITNNSAHQVAVSNPGGANAQFVAAKGSNAGSATVGTKPEPTPGTGTEGSGTEGSGNEGSGNEGSGNEGSGNEGNNDETTTKPGANNPDTLDNVTSVAAMGGISLAIAAAGIATLKKREN